jgi:hypothetical protein
MFEALDPTRQKELLEYQEQVRQDTALDLTVERPANLTDSPLIDRAAQRRPIRTFARTSAHACSCMAGAVKRS